MNYIMAEYIIKKRIFISAFLMTLALLSKQTVLVFYLLYLLIVIKMFDMKNMIINSSFFKIQF